MRGKENLLRWLICVLFLTLPVQAEYGGGSGTADDPYLIYTAEQINELGLHKEDWDKHFKLMDDIDLSSYKGTDFNIVDVFSGVFDGNSHTISNFSYSSADRDYAGLFGFAAGALIKDLGLIGFNIDVGTGHWVGSLAGGFIMKDEKGSIINCYVEDCNVSADRCVGGLVGYAGGIIKDCHSNGIISGSNGAGGLVAVNINGLISNCSSKGEIFGHDDVGGLVGDNSGIISNCFSTASVTGSYDDAGGLVGYNEGTLINCYSVGSISGTKDVGGLVGENVGNVADCYSHGNVDAEDMVGGLVGMNNSIVMASYSSSSVNGREDVGGLVGRNSYLAEILNCYASGNVLGQNYVGGLVGNNYLQGSHSGQWFYGTVHNCYSIASVSGDQQIGGLVGNDPGQGIYNSFWDIEASGQTTSYGGIGKTTAQMQIAGTFLKEQWDFVNETENGIEDLWSEAEEGGYPVLWWQLSTKPQLPAFSGGTGEHDEPYLISTADELNSIGYNPVLMIAHFKLINDIDLGGVKFNNIGSKWYPFRGVFDGNGHTISNFSYISSEADNAGLFSFIANAEIKNLGLIDPNIDVENGNFHGCLIGYLNGGIVTHCYIQGGRISGDENVGALVGQNHNNGRITDCYALTDVEGNKNVGGLVGTNHGLKYWLEQGRTFFLSHWGSLEGCYATGNVTGDDSVGGLVGENLGTVTNCHSVSSVSGGDRGGSGGLVGENDGTVMACYSNSNINGVNSVGGLIGRNSSGQTVNCYAMGTVTGQWYMGGLVGSNSSRGGRNSGTIENCYSVSAILEGRQIGGFAGSNLGYKINGCFWDVETSGLTTSYGGEGRTTVELQMAEVFLHAGWDFVDETANGIDDIWWITEGHDYPRLWWEMNEN